MVLCPDYHIQPRSGGSSMLWKDKRFFFQNVFWACSFLFSVTSDACDSLNISRLFVINFFNMKYCKLLVLLKWLAWEISYNNKIVLETRCVYKILVKNDTGINRFEDRYVDERIIQCILENWIMVIWTDSRWWDFCDDDDESSGFIATWNFLISQTSIKCWRKILYRGTT
jgi:hypothetical protein